MSPPRFPGALQLSPLLPVRSWRVLGGLSVAATLAEFESRVVGLWPVAVEQAEIAACNALGIDRAYVEPVLPTRLQVAGADVFSIGRHDPEPADVTAIEVDEAGHRYRKLVTRDTRLVGAILIGCPELTEAVTAAVRSGDIVAPSWTLSQGPGTSPRRSSRERLGISPG